MIKQKGFTLIELVVVIVILGILAVTAAPKFLNLQNDARNASLQGLKGTIQGAASIVYGKAAIDGVEGAATVKQVEGINVVYGYPTADTDGIVKAVNGLESGGDWIGAPSGAASTGSYLVTFDNLVAAGSDAATIAATGCYVEYNAAGVSNAASTVAITTGDSCK
ncbi:type II secretion system protein [Photobacterium angustum]|uniref:Type II secretion system protein n=1 Tax=Photobacterium angustum TaxID=661 RepID=A0A855SAQ4_PHOAN|nr:type II secretion system protein [Photobacterium angustum]KJF81128.1 MSHA biogenesis protein MshA [Photobacterium damselae subsp. damselae]KJG29542.1 MSHA biogenesis protein MshA [Photobacterium angustum]KJG39276.1 MSHA biogenesis protein MshA [Photobacterium angustum]KJG44640.1 MSHA biogenesis protein MshA [Photobacterium angustum]KJG48311.1 MSHA biogenesis protein MshA [Photobacterium angustum]